MRRNIFLIGVIITLISCKDAKVKLQDHILTCGACKKLKNK